MFIFCWLYACMFAIAQQSRISSNLFPKRDVKHEALKDGEPQ